MNARQPAQAAATVHPRTAAAWFALALLIAGAPGALAQAPAGLSDPRPAWRRIGPAPLPRTTAREVDNDLCRCRRLPRPSPGYDEEQKT